jgi:hypothetical protein
MDRREFTLEAALAILSGAVITISGCGGGGGGNPVSGTPPPNSNGDPGANADKIAGISANHGHRAVITSAQLVAGNSIALDIRGTADHTHMVTLNAADIASIRGGTRVQTECSTGVGHSHAVTFNPTDPNDPTHY